jgi:hypothetical protein
MAENDPVDRAEDWLDDHTQPEGDRPQGLEEVDGAPSADDLRQQQQDEMTRTGLGSPAQFKGASLGWIVGAVIGAALALVIGLAFFDGDSPARFVLPIVGACAGAAAFFVYWGGRTPELENETMTAQGRPGIGTTPRDPGTDDRGR